MLQQFVMAAALDDPATLENHDLVRVGDRAQPVRDDEDRTARDQR